MKSPLVSIIILNWNGAQFLKECLESVLKSEYPNTEILLVDNASSDGSEQIAYAYSNVRVIINPQNVGYAAGNNIGIKQAKGKYIVALNNDMVVEPAWLNEPIALLEQNDQIAIAGCRQMRKHAKLIIDGLFLSVLKDLRISAVGSDEEWNTKYSDLKSGFVIGVNGGSAIYRKSFLNDTGGFDEHFFGYYEDADLSFQALLNGWKTVYIPDSVVYHLGSASFKKNMYRYYYLLERNRLLFIYKNFPFNYLAKRIIFLLGYELRHLGGTLLKFPTLYFNTRIDALKSLHIFKEKRKANISKFKQYEKYYEDLLRNKIIPLQP